MNVKVILDMYYAVSLLQKSVNFWIGDVPAVPEMYFRARLRCEPSIAAAMELRLPDALKSMRYLNSEVKRYADYIYSLTGQGAIVDVRGVLDGSAENHIAVNALSAINFNQTIEENPVPPSEFEVNLTEALVGWKRWYFDPDHRILKSSYGLRWYPLQKVTAACHNNTKRCLLSPVEDCSCGIYAVDNEGNVPGFDGASITIVGEVYGWGRYVRGDEGWRAQFAYPKSFLLTVEQAADDALGVALMEYRVPISVLKPIKLYDPEDDGYECGANQEDWDQRAGKESGTAEGESAGTEED